MNMTNIRLIVFDVDGTLAETDDYYVDKASGLGHKILPFVSEEKFRKITRPVIMAGETVLHGFYRLLDMVGLDGVISKVHSKFSVSKEYKYKEVKGMRKTLEILAHRYKLGIISSGGRHSTSEFIKKYKLESTIQYVVSSEDCTFIKPHPAPLLKITEEAGVLPVNCILVGDTVFDIICAHRAGAFAVAVKTGFDSLGFLKSHKPDLILDSVNDLPAILGLKKGN